ncbi:hypothetical protein JMT78AECX_JMT78AEC_05573 [Escherichia coli]|nr:hypothetical protein BvCmsC51A_04046 [Escherichia coli]GDF09480.1 hypothetical protein BvCmsKKNP009_04240 [Escherichia coli]CAJ1309721.1 hypothetical protein JRT64AECX_JRT64AEC_05330 [Escherichia coli]CAJ1310151.1 hypothetical protein JRT13AECX_JRT13AEC_05315 [Escherichia coli]CAJ1310636.1 hypothetical protein JMT78AECX_JMT78AEC_05573 [Escherichia coli]
MYEVYVTFCLKLKQVMTSFGGLYIIPYLTTF